LYDLRPPKERIDRYAGPYERWVYSKELGRPFAFPAIRQHEARHMAAFLEGPGDPRAMGGADVRLPPLWPLDAVHHAVTPFAFRDDEGGEEPPDRMLARRLDTLGTLTEDGIVPRVRLNMPMAAASWVADYRPDGTSEHWQQPATTPRAVLGVIDDGLPFAHRAFLGTDGRTRISHLWLQSARALPRDRVPFGREISNGECHALRARYGPDERRLYRDAGAIDRSLPELGRVLERHSTHGAHILGLAGGNDPRIPGPPLGDDVQIVAVQLPNTVAWDTSGFGKEMFMLSALHYIFVRAGEIARSCGAAGELPLVVNLSYGWSAGRHDGQSEMEIAIEELLSRRRALQPASAIVMPTGNTFAEEMHAVFSATEMRKGPARIGWRLRPDDRTASYLEIWLPEAFDPEGWEVRVVPPPGITLDREGWIPIAPDPELKPMGDPRRFAELEMRGQNVGQLSADLHRGTRWRVMLAMIPTAETGSGRRLPPGLWYIEIDPMNGSRLGPGQEIDLWVQRDDDPRLMCTGGRQSRLEGPPGVVQGYGSLSALASAPAVIRVAGVVAGTGYPSDYSSAGALRKDGAVLEQHGAQPTFAAISDQGTMLPGLPSIGCVSGSGARLIGTSTAAALASRWMVANAAKGHGLTEGLIPHGPPTTDKDAASRAARMGAGIVPIGIGPTMLSKAI
jgi:hypothetical protein